MRPVVFEAISLMSYRPSIYMTMRMKLLQMDKDKELKESHRLSENPRESQGKVRSGNGCQRNQARSEAVGMERTHPGVPVEWETGKDLV